MVVLGQPADPLALSLPFALASAPPPPSSPIDKRAAAVRTCEVGPAGCDGASEKFDEPLGRVSASLVMSLDRHSPTESVPGPRPQLGSLLLSDRLDRLGKRQEEAPPHREVGRNLGCPAVAC